MLFCLLPMLMTACAVRLADTAPPAWVSSPPADTQADFWGVGEGADIDVATRMALRQIAGRLRVSISGVTESSVTVNQATVFRTDQTRVQEIVRETEFTGVTVKESVRHSNGVYVLVRVDRRMFVRETAARFNDVYQRVKNRLQSADSNDAFTAYRALRAALPDVEQALAQGQLLRVVEASAVDAAAMNQLSKIAGRLADSASRVKVKIEHAPGDSDMASVISQWVSKAGFQQVLADVNAVLIVKADERMESVFDTWNCRVGLSLTWRDAAGNVVANRTHDIRGSSLESAKRARQNAVARWSQATDHADVGVRLGLIQ
jgi:hypothetical protein